MMTRSLTAVLMGSLLLLGGCSQYATVKRVSPVPPPGIRAHTATPAESGENPADSTIPALLEATAGHYGRFNARPSDPDLREALNYSVSRLCSALHAADFNPLKGTLRFAGGWSLRASQPIVRGGNPAHWTFLPSDEFSIGGDYIQAHNRRPGVGSPLIAVARTPGGVRTDRFSPGPGVHYATTAVVSFSGKKCHLRYLDPLSSETVAIAGRQFPLAADFTAPLALSLFHSSVRKFEIARLLNPEKHRHTARLARLQPYDPDKIPVILVHGLMSSEAAWVPMINALRADPAIRRRFQFWFFSYPSGWPYPLAAVHLRRELDAIAAIHPGHKDAVLIGHSMGGCIARLMITDSGDRLWRRLFGVTPAETNLSPSSREILEEALIFRCRRDIARVIFMAAPLRGSDLARRPLGRFGSWLVRAPASLLGVGTEALGLVLPGEGALPVKDVPNSVDTLAPNNRFVTAINTIPISDAIPVHTICGDRGKGGNKDHTRPVMSDGVVPYWSSHLHDAVSEKLVPSGHSVHQNAAAIAETARILKLHVSGAGRPR